MSDSGTARARYLLLCASRDHFCGSALLVPGGLQGGVILCSAGAAGIPPREPNVSGGIPFYCRSV